MLTCQPGPAVMKTKWASRVDVLCACDGQSILYTKSGAVGNHETVHKNWLAQCGHVKGYEFKFE